MNNKISIGDRLQLMLPAQNGEWKKMPATVWGIHYGRHNDPVGIDLLKMRSAHGNIFPNEVVLDEKHYHSPPHHGQTNLSSLDVTC